MMDSVKTYIYDTDIRLKTVFLSESLTDIFKAQNIEKDKTELFSKAALLSAAFASEQKDDEGSVYVSIKDPYTQTALTALCETDGRLRGCIDRYEESQFSEIILTIGQKLTVRGDYQSSVMGKNLEAAAAEYFIASRQTKAKTEFLSLKDGCGFIFAEYFPGHDVNFKDENKAPNAEYIKNKLAKSISEAIHTFQSGETVKELKLVSETKIIFGCTCNKRKIKRALTASENITLPIEVKCNFCGKTYIIDNL